MNNVAMGNVSMDSGVIAHVERFGRIRDKARTITQAGRPQKGQDQIGTVARPPSGQGIVEAGGRRFDPEPGGRWIEQAGQAHGGVDAEPRQVAAHARGPTLQQVVDQGDRHFQVPEKISDAALHRVRQHPAIGAGQRKQQVAVAEIIEGENGAVHPDQGVAVLGIADDRGFDIPRWTGITGRRVPAAGAAGCQHQSQQCGWPQRTPKEPDHLESPGHASSEGKAIRALVIVILLLLIALRAGAPLWLEQRINQHLAALPVYTGEVGDVDLHLWRAAYRMNGVRIVKREAAPDKPLFDAHRLEFALRWEALWRGHAVADILVFDADIHFVDTAGERDQDGAGTDWLRLFDALTPIPVDALNVRDSAVHFSNFAGAHVYLAELNGRLHNIANTRGRSGPMPARLEARALAMDQAPVELAIDLAPRVAPPAFDLKLRMQALDLSRFRLLTGSYAPFDVDAGEMDLVMELTAAEGQVRGYAKPLLRDLKIISLEKDLREDRDNALRLALESLAALLVKLLENPGSEKIATRIPISGDYREMERHWLPALGHILANAFIRGLGPEFESEAPDRRRPSATPPPLPPL